MEELKATVIGSEGFTEDRREGRERQRLNENKAVLNKNDEGKYIDRKYFWEKSNCDA